jgi:hypothetical protein
LFGVKQFFRTNRLATPGGPQKAKSAPSHANLALPEHIPSHALRSAPNATPVSTRTSLGSRTARHVQQVISPRRTAPLRVRAAPRAKVKGQVDRCHVTSANQESLWLRGMRVIVLAARTVSNPRRDSILVLCAWLDTFGGLPKKGPLMARMCGAASNVHSMQFAPRAYVRVTCFNQSQTLGNAFHLNAPIHQMNFVA